MLYMKCEYCITLGIIKVAPDPEKPEETGPVTELCPMFQGTGYHRLVLEENYDSVRRWSVLRMLDLTYPEHKHRERTKRLMDLFHIVPLPEEPEKTEAAVKIEEENKDKE